MAGSSPDLSQAYAAFSRGSLDESSALCAAALRRNSADPAALHLAAAIELRRGNALVALERIDAAIASHPGDALQHQTRGLALRALRRLDEAEAQFRHVAALAPSMADPRASLGFCALERGDVQSAARHFAEALKLQPRQPEVLAALGAIEAQGGALDEGARHLEAALALQPQFGSAWNNLGTVRMAQGRVAQAQACFERAAQLLPDDPATWTNLGNALRKQGAGERAEAAYRQAIARTPDAPLAWQNLGNFLREEGRISEAIESLERSIAAQDLPGSHFSLGISLLHAGQLARGWEEYRWRHASRPDPAAREALARASAAKEPVELVGEQGLGDMLFFLRWASLVHARWRWSGDPRIPDLLGPDSFAGDGPTALSVPLGDLPALVSPEDVPPPVPIRVRSDALEAAQAFLAGAGSPPYVVVAWRAGTAVQDGEERLSKNLPLDELGGVLRGRPVTVISVQRAPDPGEHDALATLLGKPVADASALNADLAAMAGLLARADRYIGVSSTNVHIAAGVGLAASILVPRPWEWRLGEPGASSRWFPGYGIHHEETVGWAAARASLERELDTLWPRR